MEVPLNITLRHMGRTPALEALIKAQAARLEGLYGRITACNVTVEIPHRHRQSGNLAHVRIEIVVPGEELVVKHQPSLHSALQQAEAERLAKDYDLDTAYRDTYLVIHDAFEKAARVLEEYARRRRGDVKSHEPVPEGHVVRMAPADGYGFIQAADGHELYFHRESVLNGGFDRLRVGSAVTFVEEEGEQGPQASTVRPLHRKAVEATSS